MLTTVVYTTDVVDKPREEVFAQIPECVGMTMNPPVPRCKSLATTAPAQTRAASKREGTIVIV